MDICQIKFLNVLLWFGFSFYGIFFWWCLAYFSFVAYPSGGHSKNSVNSVLTTQTHSFSFSYDFEFLFLSSVKYWPEYSFACGQAVAFHYCRTLSCPWMTLASLDQVTINGKAYLWVFSFIPQTIGIADLCFRQDPMHEVIYFSITQWY